MTVKQAECHITILPTLDAQPIRKRTAEVNMDISMGMSTGPQPIKLTIKGENFMHVMELVARVQLPDSEIVEKVRDSILASEVEDMTDEEACAWVRGNAIDELKELAGDSEES